MSHFSVIIDETTDVSTAKELAVVTRVYDGESMNTNCPLYNLLEIARGDADSLFQALVGLLERDGISLNNIIGFAADTTNVMFGEHNSVASRLKEKSLTYFLYAAFVTVHTCVHHMPVKSYPYS